MRGLGLGFTNPVGTGGVCCGGVGGVGGVGLCMACLGIFILC